jgi:integrase
VLGPPKSYAGRRTIALPPALADMLAAHLDRLGLSGADTDAFVFPAPGGGPLRYSNWRRRVWAPARQRAGLPKVGFHDLRRAAATALVLEGVDMKTAQTRLGHADARMTLGLYAQASTAADIAASDRLGARFLGSGVTRDGAKYLSAAVGPLR